MELTLYSQLCFAVSILKKSLSKAGSELGQGPGPPLNIYQLVHRKSGVLHLFTEQMNPLHLILIFSPFQIPAIRLLYWRQQWRAPGSRGHWDRDAVLDVWHQVSSFTKYYSQCTHSWLLWRAYFWFVNPCFDGIGQLSYLCFICKLSGLLMSKGGQGPVQMNILKRYNFCHSPDTGKFENISLHRHFQLLNMCDNWRHLLSPASEAREEMAEYLIIVQDQTKH